MLADCTYFIHSPLWSSSPPRLSSAPLPLSHTMPPPVVFISPRMLSRLPASPLLCALSFTRPSVPLLRPDPSSLWTTSGLRSGAEVLVRPGGPGLGLHELWLRPCPS